MSARRRYDFAPRLEMMPLLDVVFLLLTFFIYSFVVMIRADALSVGLAPVSTGGSPGVGAVQLLTIDAEGGFAYDGEPIDAGGLDALLRDLAADPAGEPLYVTLAAEGTGDRGPVVWDLLQRAERFGMDRLVIVGPPDDAGR
ncbi:MAG: biopolymer transporter ExbD [Planctomycetota bacterium]